MKIIDFPNRQQIENYIKNAQPQNAQPAETERQQSGLQPIPAGDRVELSNSFRALRKINEMENIMDPARSQRVDNIKEQVKKGSYKLDSSRIAEGMMRDLLKNLG